MKELTSYEEIEQRIFFIRGHKVMIDRDLAEMYNVQTKYLNRQVKRNKIRFPKELMFRLTAREKNELVTKWHRFEPLKHSSALPYVFTEHGVTMIATVLNSKSAVRVTMLIIKTFVKVGQLISSNKELAIKIKEIESKFDKHDKDIQLIFQAIRELIEDKKERDKPRRPIGYKQIGAK